MTRSTTFSQAGWASAWVELLALFASTTFAAMHVFDMHWFIAMTVAPVLMLALLLAILVTVEGLWLLVYSLDRLGTVCGLRKSPLA